MRGYVTAYDAETGKLVWRFYTVPGDPGEAASRIQPLEKRRQDLDTASGGSTAAAARSGTRMAYDPELDLVYVGIGNGSPWNASHPLQRRGRQPVPVARSSRSSPTPASTSGTTRDAGRVVGLHRHAAR